jgi:BirA family biotin operon repressor/biotin-[acetyl-CoA-carboxylase] ligase
MSGASDEELGRRLAERTRFRSFEHLTRCGSTQDEALTRRGDVCIWSDEQVRGRGRKERSWFGEPGRDVEVTFRVERYLPQRPELVASALPTSILLALEDACSTRLTLKWPNDVLNAGRKLCGILMDVHGSTEPVWLIGIGVNVARDGFPPMLMDRATSLRELAGHSVPREDVLLGLAAAVDTALAAVQQGDLERLTAAFRDRTGWLGRRVRVVVAGGPTRIGPVEDLDLATLRLGDAAPVPLALIESLSLV